MRFHPNWLVLLFLLGFLVCTTWIVTPLRHEIVNLKHQAFERGYMVQCIGKTGYYWECE